MLFLGTDAVDTVQNSASPQTPTKEQTLSICDQGSILNGTGRRNHSQNWDQPLGRRVWALFCWRKTDLPLLFFYGKSCPQLPDIRLSDKVVSMRTVTTTSRS